MRLKKLEILGFKSFADKTEIAFDKGVTCIVGPNGCGKSNVSDAIRWVLGERSAKLLRGSTMEDVIFNGTEVRKPLAFAEVSLTIDNSDRGMPIDYNEVTIARRLYRTGESEYLLNKTQCRLKDIQDIILDTGIGSSSYSMIEQGRIDYILKADPEERRFLIEEAAGIAKYKVKKDESIRKLDRTEDNLKRLQDIVFEVQKNIQYAERQAKRAEKYKLELERLKTLEVKRAFYQQNQIESDRQNLAKDLQHKKDALAELENNLQKQHQFIEEQEMKVRSLGQRCHVKEGERYQVLSQIETNEQKLQFLRDKRLELAQQRGQLLQEQEQLRKEIELAIAKKIELEEQIKTKENEAGLGETKFNETAEKLKSHEILIASAKEALEIARQSFFEAAQSATQARNEYHRIKAQGDNFEHQHKRLEANATRLTGILSGFQEKFQLCLRSLDETNLSLQETLSGHQGLRTTVHAFEHELLEAEKNANNLRLALSEKESRLKTLTEIEGASEESFHNFLTQAAIEVPGLVQSLQEIIKVQEGYEWVIDVALGQFARSIVVNDVAVAKTLIARLNFRKNLSAGIIMKTSRKQTEINSSAETLGFKPMSQFVQIAEGYETLFDNVYISETFPLESIEAFLQAPPANWISKDGLFLTSDRRFFYWDDQNRSRFFFSREVEMKKLGEDVGAIKTQVKEKDEKISFLRQELDSLEKQSQEVDAQKTSVLIEKESLENEHRNITERLGSIQKEIELSAAEIEQIKLETEKTLINAQNAQNVLTQKEQDEKLFVEAQKNKERELENALQIRDALLSDVRRAQTNLDQCKQGILHLKESLQMIEGHAAKDKDRQNAITQNTARIAAKEKELDTEESTSARLAEDLQQKLRSIDVELELLHKDLKGQEDSLAVLRTALEELIQNQKKIQEDEHQISIKQMDLDYKIKNIGERLLQRYRLNLSELNPQDYAFTEDELPSSEEALTALQGKVEALGTVNLLAIEEYQELKQRYDFLLAQQKDLEDARTELMEAIRKINQTTKQLFEDTFKQVQEAFKQYYQILFRGGEAKLFLVDEAHPLESGIDIVVRPPGKKFQNMSLLSGGEKAMTAVALLFALFKIKPSPFSLLDEIDAPLDEANIDRFLAVLTTFLEQSQFIIITHNRKTISMGNSLYGVTMQEPGISKIVSVKVRSAAESITGGHSAVTTVQETTSAIENEKENSDTVAA